MPEPTPGPSGAGAGAGTSKLGTVLRAGGWVLTVAGTVFSAYGFYKDVSEGNWTGAALNGTGFAEGGTDVAHFCCFSAAKTNQLCGSVLPVAHSISS